MCVQLRKILHRLRDESGQSLIVVVSSMTVLLAMAGFGIDTATWMVKHHQDQVIADAAALAAAQCLANPSQAGSSVMINNTVTAVPSCSSGTDRSADATTVAIDYAAANGLTITTGQVHVDTGNGQVTVDTSNESQSIFARLFGIDKTTQQASSVAGWSTPEQQCSTPGQNCDFMFANSNDCNSGSYVLIVSTQGKSTINGNIQTNGSLDASETGNAGGINGQGTYGAGSCTTTQSGNPWNTAPPTQASSTMAWPIDYSKDFPACDISGGSDPCQTEGDLAPGYPSFCTNGGKTQTLSASSSTGGSGGAGPDAPQPGNIYCASGSGQPNDPSTWNGAITINISGSGNNDVFEDSFVGGTISYSGSANSTFSACGWTANGFTSSGCQAPAPVGNTANYPVFYAVSQDPSPNCATAKDSTAPSLCALSMVGTGNLTLYGDFFVENGTAWLDVHGNQSPSDTCIEANVIEATLAGNFNGDGPTPTASGGGGPSSGGVDTLLQ